MIVSSAAGRNIPYNMCMHSASNILSKIKNVNHKGSHVLAYVSFPMFSFVFQDQLLCSPDSLCAAVATTDARSIYHFTPPQLWYTF